MWKWIKKIFRKIKNFFTEPEVKPLEEYQAERLTIYEKERAGLPVFEEDKRAEQLEDVGVREQKGRYVYDERTGFWVLVLENDVRYKGAEGWGGAKIDYEFFVPESEPIGTSLKIKSRRGLQNWSDEEVLEEFYIEHFKQNIDKYRGLSIHRVTLINRLNYY